MLLNNRDTCPHSYSSQHNILCPAIFQLSLWILTSLLAFIAAPTYPTVLAWSNHYIKPASIVLGIIELGSGLGTFSATWIGGYLFHHFGGRYIFLLSLMFAVIIIIVIVPLQIVITACAKNLESKSVLKKLVNINGH